MLLTKQSKYLIILVLIILTFSSCSPGPGRNTTETGRLPALDPDYTAVTIPFNIAPLNFRIREKGESFVARFTSGEKVIMELRSGNGLIKIPGKKWKHMLTILKGEEYKLDIFSRENGRWIRYKPVINRISADPIDKYLTYRSLFPGYESWKEISIKQRDLENFREWSVIENSIADQNCVNCHSFDNSGKGGFLFHVRGTLGGTCFYDGKELRKVNLKTKEMKNSAIYPRWHPSGRFVAFSSNKIVQQFHSALQKKIEVSDLESSLVLYNVATNEITDIDLTGGSVSMDTYPEWSPDGGYLYFCRAVKTEGIFDYSKVHYNLYRASFDASTMKFGEPELIYNASADGKSASFPRVSPDGRSLVFTLHNYGVFPIWHKEADLYIIDLLTLSTSALSLNSEFTESYHSWSSDSRWLIFSSKRDDGLTARFYISHIDGTGKSDKPFILPQRDPEIYTRSLKTYNIPELSNVKIKIAPGEIRRSIKANAQQAVWVKK